MNSNNKNYKVIIAHPGQQHSFQTAVGAKKAGILFKYITTVYYKPKSLTKLLGDVLLRGLNSKKMHSRRCNDLDDSEVIQFNEFFALITLLLSRFPFAYGIYIRWNQLVASSFYKKVMKYAIRNNVNAVVVYDGYAKKYFEVLDGKNIIRIMDVSMANRSYIKKIFEEDMIETGNCEVKKEAKEYWNKNMICSDAKGIHSTDYFLAASRFVEESLIYCGISKNQIRIVPYGANIRQFKPLQNQISTEPPLNLIFVGQITYRKGIHHLLEALSTFNKEEVILTICGQINENSSIYKKYKDLDNVIFEGYITHDDIQYYYQKSDAFILPSLGEGMALVGLEAMACGLPVICTNNTGINDLIVSGENGYILKSYRTEDIIDGINWAIKNRNNLSGYGTHARLVAEQYTWEKYQSKVANTIIDIIKEEKEHEKDNIV